MGTRQWLKLNVPNINTFYTNSLPSRLFTLQESNGQVSHYFRWFPTILDGFYLVFMVLGEFQHGWAVEAGGRQDDGLSY